ncbi:MAG: hypothetical protein WC798_03790 [Candidatus Paceibacterota bacterium]
MLTMGKVKEELLAIMGGKLTSGKRVDLYDELNRRSRLGDDTPISDQDYRELKEKALEVAPRQYLLHRV